MNEIKLLANIENNLKSLYVNENSAGKPNTSFSSFFERSMEKVNELKMDADKSVEQLATGSEKDIHNTMIALQKAEISMELMLQVRNKMIAAYDEIRKMPI